MTETNTTTTELIKAGIVGTGYAASQRADTLQKDWRSHLVAISSHTLTRAQAFAQTYETSFIDSWQQLIEHPDIDVVFICTINCDHGVIARAALETGKHVVTEYPLSLNPSEAESLIALAQAKGKLLHVEHIELLGGLHQALLQFLPKIGKPFYARYVTMVPKKPAPKRWTYHPELFGFPFKAALPHVHRFTNLFGQVASVSCQSQFWSNCEYYKACLCNGQMRFQNGLIAEVTYGKGETFNQALRHFEVHAEEGTLIFEGPQGTMIQGEDRKPIEIAGRRGLFVKDTEMVLDYLLARKPLYVSPIDSYYALMVADNLCKSAETGKTIAM
ncbi:MAG: Gfo/Idh/MocA family oxidoreductase [Symploca sp. SIO2B6]|nr:Gfo/Idh/MocA family oxidoreductase [Symploca sp. SIO2B6]